MVAVRNDESGIRRCLEALFDQVGVELQIIVVDDGSTDNTARVAREFENQQDGSPKFAISVLDGRGRGAAAARNLGVKSAREERVLFTDGDCEPEPGWAKALLSGFGPGVVATKGVYSSRQTEVTAQFVQLEYEERYARMAGYESIDFLDTYCLAVDREAFLRIGGFDESFRGASVEDQEMSFRLHREGEFIFVPTAVVSHRHASHWRAYTRKKFKIGRGKATLIRRHPRRLKPDSHTSRGLQLQVLASGCASLSLGASFFDPRLLGLLAIFLTVPTGLSRVLIRNSLARYGVKRLPATLALVTLRAQALAFGFFFGTLRPLNRLGAEVDSTLRSDQEKSAPVPDPGEKRERDHVLTD